MGAEGPAVTDDIVNLGLVDDDKIMLDVAALQLAALDHPDADLAECKDILGRIAEDVAIMASSAHTNPERAQVLADVIARKHGFSGDRDTYDDPRNADLICVLERRRGMPVALSILYVAIARRVGWPAYALNTPGHVLIVIGERSGVLVDPFNNGATIGRERLVSLLAGVLGPEVDPGSFRVEPMSNRDVLVRLLMNQASRAERGGELDRALTILTRITTIAPSHAQPWWERARIELVHGRIHAARSSLSAMLETTRDPALRTHINAALDALVEPGG